MKPDHELITDIVQTVASRDFIDVSVDALWSVADHGPGRSREAADYHIWMCEQAGLIARSPDVDERRDGLCYRMTLAGWEFLEENNDR